MSIGGGGITVSGYKPSGGLGVAYALSGTQDGFEAMTSRGGSTVTCVPLTTSAATVQRLMKIELERNRRQREVAAKILDHIEVPE